METIKARFVGGPWHNEVKDVSRLPEIRHFVEIGDRSIIGSYYAKDHYFETQSYRLQRFVSEGGAKFRQYIHESLIRDGEPVPSSYVDAELPELPREMFWSFLDRLLGAASAAA